MAQKATYTFGAAAGAVGVIVVSVEGTLSLLHGSTDGASPTLPHQEFVSLVPGQDNVPTLGWEGHTEVFPTA